MNRILKEPLLHFLVLGGLIFALYQWLNRDLPDADEIRITRGQQEHLINVFTRTWQRAPTDAEFQGLMQDYIREELAYREGVAMGLDQGDTVVRRRMRQKLELLTDEVVSINEPGDEELRAFLAENPEKYRQEASYDLRHVYFSRERRGEAAESDARATLEQLQSDPGIDWTAVGDPLPLGDDFRGIRAGELARHFGSRFAEGVERLQAGRWQGPVESGFGLHLVYIDRVEPRRDSTLEAVRDAVRNDWFATRRERAIEALYERLAENYNIEIEPLTEVGGP